MDQSDWIRDILNMSGDEAPMPSARNGQFLGIIQRSAELIPQGAGVNQVCSDLVKIIIEETNFETAPSFSERR